MVTVMMREGKWFPSKHKLSIKGHYEKDKERNQKRTEEPKKDERIKKTKFKGF